MANLLHISANEFPPLSRDHSTKKIWMELAKGFDEYHILGRAQDNRFHYYNEGNIHLHLVPKLLKAPSFAITSFYIYKIIKKYNINLMLSQCPILGGFTANIIKKVFNIPLFQEIHDTYYFELFKSKKIKDRLLAEVTMFSIKNATKVRALNKMMEDMILDLYEKANTVIIENRVDINKFSSTKKNNKLHDPILVTGIGTFVYRKGFHTAINAIKSLSEKYDISLMLIGGGKDKEMLMGLAEGYTNIKLYDRLPQDKLVELLEETDIYIQPSIREGMPRTILEAMAMKLPVITTNVSTIPGTVINGVNGLIVEPEDAKQLENAIINLIKDANLRNGIVDNAYADVINKFEWNSAFELYRSELINIIK
ncbi:N-acetyl-alpha-D-glucosaminyl L-malate synthase [Neobacillus rhizosphaerae]|uniref:N-acetyl-alpha-D-glucosaminyl L-malate synthase n=1 Tax=Neobacillus rhizosphaerae TaxID=2880965 RepID=A0ABN8KSR5_9BACI|nr:glycosyltransferase family 4 protein [Neobacillus rhizosphaerae]CAH2716774.1 N-acetyl-alpha-D-glucosaminyl L-malate synthase [Neobacillus rhizosphaerae]